MDWRQGQGQGLGKLGDKRGLIYLKVNGGLTQNVCCCSFSQSRLTLCTSMDCSTPGFPVLHHLLEFAQTHVHWVSDTVQSTSKCLEFAKLNPFFSIFFCFLLLQHFSLRRPWEWILSQTQIPEIQRDEITRESRKYKRRQNQKKNLEII